MNKLINSNSSLVRMSSRLGIYNKSEKSKVVLDGSSSIEERLKTGGGFNQQSRMIYDKRRSLDRALQYSYQAATIKKVSCEDNIDNSALNPIQGLDVHQECRALINPDKNKLDYDDKILSVHFEENFHAGDVFEWVGTNTHWLVYLQDLTELAYFRSEIRKCNYEISWVDKEGETKTTYAAIRGPVETAIDYIQKHGISVDNPNHSVHILMPRNEDTLKYFQRYAKFYLRDLEKGAPEVCWRVEATDWISSEGILEINAVEYYINDMEDDLLNGVAGGLKQKEAEAAKPQDNEKIVGDIFIKPKVEYTYTYNGTLGPNDKWEAIGNKIPVILTPETRRKVKVKWNSPYSGQFKLKIANQEQVIVVESLF